MSRQTTRHFALASLLGLVPLLPATPVAAQAPASLHASAQPVVAPYRSDPFSAARIAQIRDSGRPVMQQASRYVGTAPPRGFTPITTARAETQTAVNNPRLYREIFGFAYAQSIGDPTIGYPSWNMSLLSTVAYFGVHVDWTGALVNDSGLQIWDNPNGPVPSLIGTAHTNGAKVVLTVIMGDSGDLHNMCSAMDRWQTTVQQTVAEVKAKGADGVNIDFEGSYVTCNDPGFPQQSSQSLFTNLVAQMRAALPAGSYLSVDTYSGSAGYRTGNQYLGFFDIGGLSNYVDSFMVMAYDMEYDNANYPPVSCPYFCIGPTAPLSTYYWNDTRASNEYTAVVPASKIIMGIPYYGRKECVNGFTPSDAPPNAEGINVAADGYLDASTENGYYANSDYHIHREVRDTQGNTRWDTFTSSTAGCTREMYWDDADALGRKYDLVINNRLRGIGIFTLSYGGGAPELWSLINLKFGQCSEGAITANHLSPQMTGTSVTFNADALCAGTANFRFWMQAPGATSMTLVQPYGTQSSWTWNTAGLSLGNYTFQIDARNQGAASTADTSARMSFRLATCAAPAVTTSPVSPQLPGTTVTFSASAQCQGTAEYQFWMLAPGSSSWQIVQPYSTTSSYSWSTGSLYAGNYLYSVWVRNAGTSGIQCSSLGCNEGFYPGTTYALTNTPCQAASDAPAPASPQLAATTVVFSANSGACPHPLYQFWLRGPSSSWQVVQPYSKANTYTWDTTGLPAGTYYYTVWARDANSPGITCGALGCNDSVFVAQTFNLNNQPCTSVSETASAGSPQPAGTTITLTATATGCPSPLYQFWLKPPDGSWQVVRPYAAGNTLAWNTAGMKSGTYMYTVWARDKSSNGTQCSSLGCDDAFFAAPSFSVSPSPCTSVTESPVQVSPQLAGTPVTFTASASGCPSPLYQFWLRPPGGSWQVAQSWSSTNTFSWNTGGLPAGDYLYTVWAMDPSSSGIQCGGLGCTDAVMAAGKFTVLVQPCTSVTDTPSPPLSPQPSGTPVTFTANATGCPHPLYQFWIRPPGGSWQVVQAWSSTNTFAWNTSGLPPGNYLYTAWARDSSSSGSQCGGLGCTDAVMAAAIYGLQVQPCTGVTASPSPGSPSGRGTTVVFTASASGCPHPLYQFWIKPPGGSWQVAQTWSSSNTFSWDTTGLPSGAYLYSVWVRDGSSTGTQCSSLGCNDAYFPGTSYTLS